MWFGGISVCISKIDIGELMIQFVDDLMRVILGLPGMSLNWRWQAGGRGVLLWVV